LTAQGVPVRPAGFLDALPRAGGRGIEEQELGSCGIDGHASPPR
jgi:hypothetical protein